MEMGKSANRQMGKSANGQIGKRTHFPIFSCSHLPIFPFSYLLICLLAVAAACTQTPTSTIEAVQFSLVADTSTAPLVDELVAAYLADRPHVTIQVARAANAQRTLEALQAGQFDLASISWLPEREKAADTLWYRPYARDALVVITHPTNPVGGLTVLQLRTVFQGQLLYWTELGGLSFDVTPVVREDGAGARWSFESLVLGGRAVTPTAVVMPSNEMVVEYVSATPGAIGYISSGWMVPAVNVLAVESTTPSPASVAEGRYLLARPFFLVAGAEPVGGLAEFAEWVRVGEGQEVVKRLYAPAP
jgi:phosphate transport system substrate-binding protein